MMHSTVSHIANSQPETLQLEKIQSSPLPFSFSSGCLALFKGYQLYQLQAQAEHALQQPSQQKLLHSGSLTLLITHHSNLHQSLGDITLAEADPPHAQRDALEKLSRLQDTGALENKLFLISERLLTRKRVQAVLKHLSIESIIFDLDAEKLSTALTRFKEIIRLDNKTDGDAKTYWLAHPLSPAETHAISLHLKQTVCWISSVPEATVAHSDTAHANPLRVIRCITDAQRLRQLLEMTTPNTSSQQQARHPIVTLSTDRLDTPLHEALLKQHQQKTLSLLQLAPMQRLSLDHLERFIQETALTHPNGYELFYLSLPSQLGELQHLNRHFPITVLYTKETFLDTRASQRHPVAKQQLHQLREWILTEETCLKQALHHRLMRKSHAPCGDCNTCQSPKAQANTSAFSQWIGRSIKRLIY